MLMPRERPLYCNIIGYNARGGTAATLVSFTESLPPRGASLAWVGWQGLPMLEAEEEFVDARVTVELGVEGEA